MIPPNLRLHIVTPDKPVVNETVDEVAVPAAEGQIGVLPGHTPTLVSLSTGELWYRTGQEKRYVAVFFGFAERPEDIAVPRAEAARKRAQDEYGKATTEAEFDAARIALMKSQVRLQVATRAGVHA
jgi:F-type H+-transporting ATPase subunit epsilon